ncbi:hypothetical protein ACFE04_029876 [Oxalis oulophora]
MSSIASDSSFSTALEGRNWLELPDDVTAKILMKLSLIDIMVSAQVVCLSWRRICKDTSMWRRIDVSHMIYDELLTWLKRIDMSYIWKDSSIWQPLRKRGELYLLYTNEYLWKMCYHAVNLSDGQLIDLNFESFYIPGLLQHIIKRSSGLKRLRIASAIDMSNEGLIKAASQLPLLEELELTNRSFSKEALKAVGRSCPLLFSFKLNTPEAKYFDCACDDQALAIAETMPGLCHLELVGNSLSRNGLQAISNGCPHLESLDVNRCFFLSVRHDDPIHRIKSLKLPEFLKRSRASF